MTPSYFFLLCLLALGAWYATFMLGRLAERYGANDLADHLVLALGFIGFAGLLFTTFFLGASSH